MKHLEFPTSILHYLEASISLSRSTGTLNFYSHRINFIVLFVSYISLKSPLGFLLRFVTTGAFSKVRGTNMPPFLAMWLVGVGVGRGCPFLPGVLGGPLENFKYLGPNGCILGYFWTLSVLIVADITRHSLVWNMQLLKWFTYQNA